MLEYGFAGYVMLFVWSRLHVTYTPRKWEPSVIDTAIQSAKYCKTRMTSCLLTNDFFEADEVFSFRIFGHALKSIISVLFAKTVS